MNGQTDGQSANITSANLGGCKEKSTRGVHALDSDPVPVWSAVDTRKTYISP